MPPLLVQLGMDKAQLDLYKRRFSGDFRPGSDAEAAKELLAHIELMEGGLSAIRMGWIVATANMSRPWAVIKDRTRLECTTFVEAVVALRENR